MFGEYNFSEEGQGKETLETVNDNSTYSDETKMVVDTGMILDAEWA